jgi:hypothetical protein
LGVWEQKRPLVPFVYKLCYVIVPIKIQERREGGSRVKFETGTASVTKSCLSNILELAPAFQQSSLIPHCK